MGGQPPSWDALNTQDPRRRQAPPQAQPPYGQQNPDQSPDRPPYQGRPYQGQQQAYGQQPLPQGQPIGRAQHPYAQQPQRSYGRTRQPPYGPPERRGPRKSRTARHKVLTIIGGTFGVFIVIVIGVIGAIAGAGKQPSPAPAAAAASAVPSTAATHSPKATRAAATHPAVRAKTSSKPKGPHRERGSRLRCARVRVG